MWTGKKQTERQNADVKGIRKVVEHLADE